jgi:hypothetical protein
VGIVSKSYSGFLFFSLQKFFVKILKRRRTIVSSMRLKLVCLAAVLVLLLSISVIHSITMYTAFDSLPHGAVHYWKISNISKGDLVLLTIAGDPYWGWESQLCYMNFTVIETNADKGTHIHQFIANYTGDLMLRLQPTTIHGSVGYGCSIQCSHPISAVPMYTSCGFLPFGGVDYVKISNVNKGDLFLLTVTGDEYWKWTTQLSYANLTIIETNGNVGTHITQFYADTSGDFLLKLQPTTVAGTTGIGYTIQCTHFVPSHNIAVTNISTDRKTVVPGDVAKVFVGVSNLGDFNETFNATAFCNGNSISTIVVSSLGSKENRTLEFQWDTAGLAEGNYSLSAQCSVVQFETNSTDNNINGGIVSLRTSSPTSTSQATSGKSATATPSASLDAIASSTPSSNIVITAVPTSTGNPLTPSPSSTLFVPSANSSTPATSSNQTGSNSIMPNYVVPIAVIVVVLASVSSGVAYTIRHKQKNSKKMISDKGTDAKLVPPETDYVFISHVKEDGKIAEAIAKDLEKAGYASWYYERDSLPGQSYILTTSTAIEQSKAVILILSRESLRSNQVHTEVITAHEAGIHFVPVLSGIIHEEFQQSRPEWRRIIGSSTSVSIPREGVSAIMPRLIAGLTSLGVQLKTKSENPEEK